MIYKWADFKQIPMGKVEHKSISTYPYFLTYFMPIILKHYRTHGRTEVNNIKASLLTAAI